MTSAGYGEAGDAGKRAEAELVALCDELGILLAGPNGQGVVSTPVKLCAQMVAPYPPAGRIGIASQSGNFVSSFLNLARASGVGVSRAVSAGNAAAVSVADFLDHYADDDATAVGLAYVEGIGDGRSLLERFGRAAARKPLVLVKGGATEGGARAAASHTGALAADDKVFDGACRAAGITRAATIEEAFEAAATFATQPPPPGPNVVVLTTAGGWGVVTADAIARDPDLELLVLPDDLRDAIDRLLPPRWSRNNPVDCAGGETRDTIPEVMRLLAEHDDVHAIVYLGLGIQSNQARMMRDGRFYPGYGLERIVAYHERQDARFAEAADELSRATGKPILTATELAVADPDNPGPAAVRASGRLCYPSGNRAVTALGHLYRDARHRARRAPVPTIVSATSPGAAQPARRPRRRCARPRRRAVRAVAMGGVERRRRRAAAAVDRRPARTVGDALATPLLSFRRAPGVLSRDVNLAPFQAEVDEFAATLDAPSCVAVAVDGVPVGSARADTPLIPASNQKLLVAAVALRGARQRLHVHDRGARGGATDGWSASPATSTSSAAAIRC